MKSQWLHKRFFGEWTPAWVMIFASFAVANPISGMMIAHQISDNPNAIVYGACIGLAIMASLATKLAWDEGGRRNKMYEDWQNATCPRVQTSCCSFGTQEKSDAQSDVL